MVPASWGLAETNKAILLVNILQKAAGREEGTCGMSSAFADLEACRVQRQQNVGLLNLGAEELACPVYSCRTYLADAREKQNALGFRVL